MRFVYLENAGDKLVRIEGEKYAHLFKVRRADAKNTLFSRNLRDDNLYSYKVSDINKKEALCELIDAKKIVSSKTKDFYIAWSVVEPKIVEKTLPYLNEIGLKKLIFIYTQFSQRNFKIDFQRLKRVLINSCEQCGRGDLMEFEIFASLDEFLKKYDDIAVVDFSETRFEKVARLPKTWLIGCEGGFSDKERERLENFTKVGFETDNILRSENAVAAITAKLFL